MLLSIYSVPHPSIEKQRTEKSEMLTHKRGTANTATKERVQLASDGKWATLIQMLWGDIGVRDAELSTKPPTQARTGKAGPEPHGEERHTAGRARKSDT